MSTPTVDELSVMLTSPDPGVRDRIGYSQLARAIARGELDGDLAAFGDRVAAHFNHPEIQARTFAPLILDSLVSRDNIVEKLDTDTVLRWRDRFATWWAGEVDLRGYDEKLGWLHAVAHGADLLGTLGTSRHLDESALIGLLEVARERLMAPTDYLFAHGEDDRTAAALALVLARDELTATAAIGWLEPIRAALEAGKPGPVPAHVSNTIRTLNSLYVVIDRGVRPYAPPGADRPDPSVAPHRSAILSATAGCLRLPNGYLA
jgi:hypothetical protein